MTFLDLARDLARLRKAHATEFLYQRVMHSRTDGQAKAAADEKYIADLTMAEARYEIAKAVLHRSDIDTEEREGLYQRIEESYDHPGPNPDTQPRSPDAIEEGPDKDCAD